LNNYAVSSDGIATALQDSASALMEGGNNLEQAVALVAAANRVVQDPNSVGSALRTISLRLRGTSVEVLEELGEETDNVVESTSKLQKKIQALSGVDILTESGDYKDTYTILAEIGEVWENMSDIDQAALLELMAGKNRANTLSAILSNMKDLKGAYQDALAAEGSAWKENETYLNSIQGRIDLFKNELQTFWMNLVDSNAIKAIVDFGTTFLNILNKMMEAVDSVAEGWGSLGVILPTILLSISSSVFKTNHGIEGQFGLIKYFGKETKGFFKGLWDTYDANFSKSMDLVSMQANGATSSLLGASKAGQTMQASWAALTATIGSFGAALLGIVAVVGIAVTIYDALTISHKEYLKQLEKDTKARNEIKEEQKAVNTELETTNKRIEELLKKDTLSFTEQEELDRLREYNNELERQAKILQLQDKREKQNQIKDALGAIGTSESLQEHNIGASSYALGGNGESNIIYSGNMWEYYLNAAEGAKVELDKAEEVWRQAVENNADNEDELRKILDNRQKAYDDANAKLDEYRKDFEDKYGDIEYTDEPTTDKEKEWNEIIRQVQEYINKQEWIAGNFGKSDILSGVFGKYATDSAKAFKEEFEKGLQEGKNPSQLLKELFTGNREYASVLSGLYEYGIDTSDIVGYFTQTGEEAEKAAEKVKTIVTSLDKLTSSIDSYKAALQIVNEITHDGQAISEEYYNTLKEQLADVTYGTQDFSDAIDTSNGYVVKNVSLLQKLVTQSKNTSKATLQSAKAQAQLQYHELVNSIRKSVIYLGAQAQAHEFVSRAVADNINVMRDQMETIDQTMQEYALLELSLSDAANAFDEYEKAKERDAKLTYDDSMLEMLKTIDEGLLKNETGTEAFEYAVKAIVPEKFWKDIDDVDEKIRAIHDYIDGDNVFSRFFYVDEDSGDLDITTDNVREFVDLCIDSGLFDGSSKDFALNNSVEGIKDFAEGLGVTEAVALAMLTALEKVDAKWGNILTDVTLTPFERSLSDVSRDMAELNEQLADGSIQQTEYAEQMALKEVELAKLTKEARDGLLGSADKYNYALQHLNQTKEEAMSVGYDGVQSKFGNIDTNDTNRILNWTEQSLEANKEALLSWEKETTESIDEAWARIKSEFEGSYSTVATSWDTFDGIDIAFTPMLQTDNGPVYVNANTLTNYVAALVAKAKASGQEPTYDVLMKLDEQGLDGFEQSGYRIKGVLADVGETASKTAEIMHFAGSTGAIADAENQLDYARGYIELQKQVIAAQKDVDKSTQNLIEKQKDYNDAVAKGFKGDDLHPYEEALADATEEFNIHNKALDEVIKKRDELEKYSGAYTIEFVLADIDAEIKSFGDKFSETAIKNAGFEKDADGIWKIKAGMNLDDMRVKHPELIRYVELLNQQTELTALLDPTQAEAAANALQATVDGVIQAIEANLITLELDTEAVNNVVEQANKILGGIASEIGVWLNTNLSDRTKKILKFLGFDLDGSNTQSKVSDTSNASSYSAVGSNTNRRFAHATGSNNGLKANEHNAVVGELGQEMVVDPNKGVYYTVGDNGTEMVDLPKGAIIYNHKQTEELLKNGKTSRGKLTGGLSFANGNAHEYGLPSYHPNLEDKTSFANYTRVNNSWDDATSTLLDAADALADASDSLEDTINWIDVLFTRIENNISEQEAYLATIVDSTGGLSKKNSVYNNIFDQLYSKANASLASRDYYSAKAASAMAGLPVDIQNRIKSGAIDITEFKFDKSTEGLTETQKKAVEQEQKAFEKYVEQIQNAIEYYDKISEYEQQYWTTIEEIANKSVERQEEVATAYENEISLTEHLNDMLEAHNDLLETREGFAAEAYYKAQISANKTMLSQYKAERKALQDVLDEEVKLGHVKIGDQQWFEMQQAIYDVDDAIIDMEASIEDLQNSINDLHWDRFDELINRFGYIEEEISNVIQLISHDPDGLIREELRDLTTDNWATGSGLTTIGLYAQEMERAQYVANEYAQAIKDLKKDYAAGKYNETEYLNKLNELISAQYENIEKYYDAKDAIIELNEARVDAIKDGIEKEIDAYDELIQKKKDLLDEEQSLHDFQNEISEKEKEVSDIRKQLAAMAGDDTAATNAKRKQLEAELIEAQKALEESYYSHSMTARQEALDKEFISFEEEKNAEITKWEEWLTDTETVVSEALTYVKDNTNLVYQELTTLGSQYGLTLSDTLTTPWQNGQTAIDSYSITFEEAKSNFTSMLDEIALHWSEVTAEAERAAKAQADALKAEYNATVNKVHSAGNKSNGGNTNNPPKPAAPATPAAPKQPAATTPTIKVGGKINAGSALIYEWAGDTTGARQYYRNDPYYTVLKMQGDWVQVRHHKLKSGITGWFKKSDVKAYARGTLGTNKNQWALIDELGEELVVNADGNGRLSYLTKGTGVVPADLTEKIMKLALDPASALDGAIPKTRIPSVTANNFDVNLSFDSLVHADNVTQDTLPELQKVIRNEFNYMMKEVNNGLKRAGKSR
jgi:hypothetical protein